MDVTSLTISDLEARCAHWQRILRLQDWEIEVVIARRHAMLNSSNAAQVWASAFTRTATITILDPMDQPPEASARIRDMEDSLVHELLHLHLHDCHIPKAAPNAQIAAEEIAEERCVDALASALLQLERQGDPR